MVMSIQLPAGVSRRYAALAAFVIGSMWLWVAFDLTDKFPPHHIAWNISSSKPLSTQSAESSDIFDFPPVESEAIKSICGETQWNSSVVFTCDESVGGIGNIRNSILLCVRYAISAGASLVVPRIVLRDALDISHIRTGLKTDLSYLFDKQHFLQSIYLSCPQLKLYSSLDDINNAQNIPNTIPLLPESLVDYLPKTGLPDPASWRTQFYTWLEQFSTPQRTGPMLVALGRSYLTYPIYSDGEAFALSFGTILKFRSDIRVLAMKTLQRLAYTYSFPFEPSAPVMEHAFFGVHLRTEKDAVEGWPAADWLYSRYETQSNLYLQQAQRSNLSVIYVASGDQDEVLKFADDAANAPSKFHVTTKFDVLSEGDLVELSALKWDQQALVDFLVLLKASDFAGIGHSSFAWNIALKRHVVARKRQHLDGPQLLSDELSQIYGLVRGYPEYASCLWP